jgi:plastocyanin
MRRLLLPAAGLAGLALAVVPALAADQTVHTNGNRFTPEDVAVVLGAGNKVTITNDNGGIAPHDLRWQDGAPGEPGATKSMADQTPWSVQRTFDTEPEGRYEFYCSVHGDPGSGMHGTVFVNQAGTVPSGGGGGTTTTSTTPPPGGTTTETTPPPPGGTTTSTTPPPGGDTTPPSAGNPRARATRRGVRLVLTLSEPADVTVRVLRRGRRVARRTFDVNRSGRVVLRVRRALRRGRYGIRLTLVDAAGNRATKRLRARVR